MWMKLLFLLICLSPSHAYADGSAHVHCHTEIGTTLDPQTTAIANQFSRVMHPAVSVLKITGPVHCRRQIPSHAQMRDWLLHAVSTSEKSTRVIHGIQFVDQPEALLDLFEKMTTIRNPQFAAEQKTFTVTRGCQQVVCALEQIFQGQDGIAHAYLARRYGLYPAQFSGTMETAPSRFRNFSEAEFRDVLAALVEIPAHLEPVIREEFIARVDGLNPRRPKNWADATIQLFNPWGQLNSQNREPTIYHEWAHLVAHALKLDNSPDWLKISKPGSGFVSEYAELNGPVEDFAECVTAYRYNPTLLLRANADKYAYIKKHVFAGREFLNNKSCALSQ
jgi:hypothetical protein